jgi:hypothetical protein
MRFHHVTRYPAPADRVLAMVTDLAFREEVCQAQKAVRHSVAVTGSGVGATVVVDRTQSMAKAPAAATKLVGDSVRIVQTERWNAAERADLDIEIPGKPGHLRGTVTLRPRPDGGCDHVVAGELKVSLPLVGGRLESLVEGILVKALDRESTVGQAWLARPRG